MNRIDHAANLEFPYYFGGGLFCEGAGLTIAHSIFSNCTAWFGAGLYITYSDAYLTDCLITGNLAIAEGASLFASFSTIKVENSIIENNTGDHVGGIYFYLNDQAETLARALSIQLETEFLITEDYLKTFTKEGLIELGAETGCFAYLEGEGKMPQGKLILYKKKELIDLFLKKGFELNGCVPKEISELYLKDESEEEAQEEPEVPENENDEDFYDEDLGEA